MTDDMARIIRDLRALGEALDAIDRKWPAQHLRDFARFLEFEIEMED